MTENRFFRLLATTLLCAVSSLAGAQAGLTPARYFECQIAARLATVVGLQERQAMVKGKPGTEAERQAAGDLARNRVTLAFSRCGHGAGSLGAYAHRNADELQTWLNANPQVKARLDAEAQRVTSLSAGMPATMPNARR